MKARYSGHCKRCNGRIAKGSDITSNQGAWIHATCGPGRQRPGRPEPTVLCEIGEGCNPRAPATNHVPAGGGRVIHCCDDCLCETQLPHSELHNHMMEADQQYPLDASRW